MKRVLFVSNLFPRPDAPHRGTFNAAFVLALHKLLSAEGGGATVVVPVPEWRVSRWPAIRGWQVPASSGNFTGCEVQYVPCFHIPLIGRLFAWRFHLAALRAACAEAMADSDAILASWLYPDAVALQKLAAKTGKPCWIRLHGTDRFHLDHGVRGTVCRRALDTCMGIFVNAQFMKKELTIRGISEAQISVVPNGIDRALFYPGDPHQRARDHILWVGNLVDIKRPELALHTVARMQNECDPVHLVMVGSGVLRQRLEVLACRLGIAERVFFVGNIGRQDLADRMRRAGALLLTSRSEGMPNVVIEALACGTPVVSTTVGDVPMMIQQGRNGFIVESGGEEKMPERLADVLRKVAAAEWSAADISNGVARHDWSESAKAVLETMNTAGCR